MPLEKSFLSVLMPVFNEEGTVEEMIARVLALGDILKEVVVVNDGSTDGTAAVLDRIGKSEPRVQCFNLERNQGKTAAIRFAVGKAAGDVLIVQDADLEYDPAEIPEVIAPILAGRADVVYGSRFLARWSARVLYYYHYLANKFLTVLSNLLTNRNMTDIETCYKAFRSGVIKPMPALEQRIRHGSGDYGDGLQDPRADLRSADLLFRADLRGGEEDLREGWPGGDPVYPLLQLDRSPVAVRKKLHSAGQPVLGEFAGERPLMKSNEKVVCQLLHSLTVGGAEVLACEAGEEALR